MLSRLPLRWIDDCRTRRMVELSCILCVLSLADLFFTVWAHLFTPFIEMNPMAAFLLDHGHIPALIMSKIALTGFGVAIFWRLRRYAKAELALWALVIVYVCLTLRWSNYTTEVIGMGQASIDEVKVLTAPA